MKVLLVSINKIKDHPLAPLVLKSYLLHNKVKSDIDIKVFDIETDSNDIVKQIKEGSYDIIGFSVHSWSMKKVDEICLMLKDEKILTILGGPYITFNPEPITYNSGIDIIVKGEGEETLYKILNGNDLETIPNILFRTNNNIMENHSDFSFDITKQEYNLITSNDFPETIYETSRGCPYKCNYCCWDVSKKNFRFYPLEKVLKDLQNIFNNEIINHLFIVDSDFFIDKERGIFLLSYIDTLNQKRLKKGFDEICLSICISPETLDSKTIDKLNQPRKYYKISCGLQTIHKEVNMMLNRKLFNLQKYSENIKKLEPISDYLAVELIYGLPSDSFNGFLESLKYVTENFKTKFLNCYRFVLVPGSYFWYNWEKFGLQFSENPPHRIISTPTFSYDEILKAKEISKHYEMKLSGM